jgi:hypothetical protein
MRAQSTSRGGRVLTAILAAGAALAAGQAVSTAGTYTTPDQTRQTANLVFKNERPGKPTGLTLDIDYVNPADPEAKPPAVRRVVTVLAKGARYDTSVPELCEASDAELQAMGESACPQGSKVGKGEVTVDSGFPGPGRIVNATVDFFNNTKELIFLNTVSGTEARTVIRGQMTRRKITTDVQMLPGTPPDGGAIDTVHIDDRRIVAGKGAERSAYITTPGRCPRDGDWTNRVRFTYSDGVTQVVKSDSPCEDPKR